MKAMIYSRVSTDAQERDGTSLDTQERACAEYAIEQGWEVVRRIRDTDSGALLERGGLTELREALRHGTADVIVAYAVDRLSRSQNHIGLLFDEFEGAGATIAFVRALRGHRGRALHPRRAGVHRRGRAGEDRRTDDAREGRASEERPHPAGDGPWHVRLPLRPHGRTPRRQRRAGGSRPPHLRGLRGGRVDHGDNQRAERGGNPELHGPSVVAVDRAEHDAQPGVPGARSSSAPRRGTAETLSAGSVVMSSR